MANNIWQGTRDGFVFWRDGISPIDMTRDMIHAETGSVLKVRKQTYSTKEAAAKRLPFFKDAIFANPKLVDPANGNYRLRQDSPAIDAGVVIPGVNDTRVRGKAPDVGAIEFRTR